MNVRRKARESALQILYKVDVAENRAADLFDSDVEGLDHLAGGTEARRYCETLVRGVLDNLETIDKKIEEYSENWTIDRMAIVDRNVLRVAVYEFLYSGDVPFKVIIDEAVELAKKYGSEESGAFINGILDRMHRTRDKKATGR